MRMFSYMVLAVLMMTAAASGQGAYDELLESVRTSAEQARTKMASSPADAPMRAHLQWIDELRAHFVDQYPNHPQVPVVQIDRALDMLLNEYELDGLRLMSLYGVMTDGCQ